jgi:hypothetical protein
MDYPNNVNLWFFGFKFINKLFGDLSAWTYENFPSLRLPNFLAITLKKRLQNLLTHQQIVFQASKLIIEFEDFITS